MKKQASNLLSDEEIIQQFLQGDNNVLGIIYERYANKVYYKCLSFSKDSDTAFDLSHDIMLKVFSNIASFKNDARFSTWLYSITYNYCVDYYRKKVYFEDLSKSDAFSIIDEEYDYENEIKHETKKEKLMNIIANAPDAEKEILIEKYIHKKSIFDLQSEMKISNSAVKMRLLRARQRVENEYYALMPTG